MSDSAPAEAVSPDCETPETVTLATLANQLRDADIHIGIYHPRTRRREAILTLQRAIAWHTLTYGDTDPGAWRAQVVEALDAQFYKTGCCTWRD